MKGPVVGLVVLLVLSGGCAVTADSDPAMSTTPTPASTSTSTTSTTSSSTTIPTSTTSSAIDWSGERVVTVLRHEDNPELPYVLDVSVPRLEGLDDLAVQDAVNTELASDIGGAADEFASQATEYEEGFKNEFSASYTTTLLEDGLFSVTVTYYEYWSGAAHGFSIIAAYIFDLATGARLGLADITTDSDGLRDLVRQGVADQVYGGDRTAVEELISGRDLLDVASFSLDEDDVVVSFSQYEVAFGAAGIVMVHVPYEQLEGSVPPGSPLARLITSR